MTPEEFHAAVLGYAELTVHLVVAVGFVVALTCGLVLVRVMRS